MATLAFDTLRYARSLKEAGVPEPQAEVQAELMAEAFGFYAENLLTRDHFTEVLNARFSEFAAQMDQRFAEQVARFEPRCLGIEPYVDKPFSEVLARIDNSSSALEATFERRFAKFERTQHVNTWMLGVVMVVLVVPQLSAWLA